MTCTDADEGEFSWDIEGLGYVDCGSAGNDFECAGESVDGYGLDIVGTFSDGGTSVEGIWAFEGDDCGMFTAYY